MRFVAKMPLRPARNIGAIRPKVATIPIVRMNYRGFTLALWSLGCGGMGFATERRGRTNRYDHRPLPNTLRQRVLGGTAVVSVAALCAWILCGALAGRQIQPSGNRGDKLDLAARGDKLAVLKPSTPTSNVYASLFDPQSSFDFSSGRFANNSSFQRDGKLFGKPSQVKLAYATTDDGLGDDQMAAGQYDQWTAVYDISAHTAYMPDGTQLEAHSGFSSLLDDPNHADEKMRGVTPPNVYDLELREELFHGVRALRLIPEDTQKVYGRAGLLAHSFMLGPNGDSNGCVSFKNYDAFLQAYLDHKVKRLAVVTSL
jgi:hypothetical protein